MAWYGSDAFSGMHLSSAKRVRSSGSLVYCLWSSVGSIFSVVVPARLNPSPLLLSTDWYSFR